MWWWSALHVVALALPGIAVLFGGAAAFQPPNFYPEQRSAARTAQLNAAWFAPLILPRSYCPPRPLWCLRLRGRLGGETPRITLRAFSDYFKNARYIDAYGLTESCGGDTFMEAGREIEKIGSTGRAIAHVEIEIRDDAGNRLPSGENGEICLRGPKVTQGYWKDPEKTAAAFFGDWFRTGDVGYLDEDGFLNDREAGLDIPAARYASSEVEASSTTAAGAESRSSAPTRGGEKRSQSRLARRDARMARSRRALPRTPRLQGAEANALRDSLPRNHTEVSSRAARRTGIPSMTQ